MDIDTENELETKTGIPSDAAVTHAALMRAFEEFKEANDLRLAGTVRHRTDFLLNEKLARIDRAIDTHARRLDEITLKGARPTIGNGRSLVGSPGLAVGWIGETEIRTQTAAPALDELAFPAMALYAMPAVTATLLEDSPANAQYMKASKVSLRLIGRMRARLKDDFPNCRARGLVRAYSQASQSRPWSRARFPLQ